MTVVVADVKKKTEKSTKKTKTTGKSPEEKSDK